MTKWDGWCRDYISMSMIDTGVGLCEFEQDVELELQRRGHAAPGEGQHISGWYRDVVMTPWVTTYIGWSPRDGDLERGVSVVCDELEEQL